MNIRDSRDTDRRYNEYKVSRDTDRRYNEYKGFKRYRGYTRELTVTFSLYQ